MAPHFQARIEPKGVRWVCPKCHTIVLTLHHKPMSHRLICGTCEQVVHLGLQGFIPGQGGRPEPPTELFPPGELISWPILSRDDADAGAIVVID